MIHQSSFSCAFVCVNLLFSSSRISRSFSEISFSLPLPLLDSCVSIVLLLILVFFPSSMFITFLLGELKRDSSFM